MIIATLRKWGGAPSPPKKLLAALELEPEVGRYTLRRLEKEQRAVERARGRATLDRDWLDAPARGREHP